MAIFGLSTIQAIVIAAAVGQVYGFSGFAQARDFEQAQQVIKEVRLDQIRNRIDQTRQRQCQAIMEGNRPAMQVTYEQMQTYINQHYSMAGFQYRVPDCGELIPYVGQTIRPPTPTPTVPPG